MSQKNVDIKLTKSQIEFLQLRLEALYTLFSGGYGSGKSYAASTAIVLDMMENPNAIIGVFAPTVAHVRDIVMRYVLMRLEEFGFERGRDAGKGDFTVNKNEMKIISNHPQLCDVWFKTLDDPEAIVGYEFYKAHIDELDTLATDKASLCWDKVIARTRQKPKGLDRKYMQWNNKRKCYEPRNTVSVYSTPEGFKFTYQTWAKNKKGEKGYNPEYKYVKAKSLDNPELTQTYIDQLTAKYSGPLAKAYLEGEWVNMQSGTVYYSYDEEEHNSTETIKPGETLYIGVDFNVQNMTGIICVKRRGGKEVHVVDEITGAYDTPELIEIIQEEYQSKGHKIICYPDSTGRSRRDTNADLTSILLLRQAGFRVKADDANPKVKDRVNTMNQAFMRRTLFVNSVKCRNLVECLQQQAYTKAGKPDKDSGLDHCNDALGYAIFKLLNIKPKVVHIKYSFPTRA